MPKPRLKVSGKLVQGWFRRISQFGFMGLCVTTWLAIGFAHASHEPMPLRPAQDDRPRTNPPVFTWPGGKGPFYVEIEAATGDRIVRRTDRNWLTLDQVLPDGQYRWRWQGPGTQSTPWIGFRLDQGAVAFPIPNAGALLERARSKSHPRSVSVDVLRRQASPQAIANLRHAVGKWRGEPLPPELPVPDRQLSAAALNELHAENRRLVFGEEYRVLASAWLWLVTGEETALAEAKRRALHVAAWDATGMTSFDRHDQAGRSVAWILALAYDWLHERLTNEERQVLLNAIKPRLAGMLGRGAFGIDGSRHLDRNPFDSHGVTAIARSSLICAALAGQDALYDRCFLDVVPRYLAWPVAWGWDQGGFANGTAYAHWQVLDTQLPVFNLLGHTLGMDLTRHPWMQEYGKYLAYFLPPGAPSGLFGSETERAYPNVWATQGKAYAAAFPSPLADWYARNQSGEHATHLALLLAPFREWSSLPGHLPPGTPHAIHLADIGWVAMHSDLGDRSRTSVYFKSSPYGSYNHSHADQNSFVIHARRRVLAADSGYYDYYGSPHWKDWYKQTRAHNAITFDGGQGQLHDTMKAKGRITHFEHNAEYDIATGDATEAYGGALTKAIRTLVFLRPNTVLVYDVLESATPRTWEWNLHALSRMKEQGARELEIEQDGVRLCVKLLSAPPGTFSQTDQFTTPPQGSYPRQWHARLATRDKAMRGVFLAWLDVGCGNSDIRYSQSGDQHLVNIGEVQFAFSADGDVKRVK